VRIVFYTDKTIAQSMTALNERLQAKGSRNLEGWVEKNGHFSLSIATPVIGKIMRRTHLRGKVERESGVTQVILNVPSGATRVGQAVIFVACGLLALALLVNGTLLPALLILFAGAALYVPLAGDQKNSPLLLNEVQRTLKTSVKPPRKSETKPPVPKASTPKSPAARRPPAPGTTPPTRK
jgi:hypothetical protein